MQGTPNPVVRGQLREGSVLPEGGVLRLNAAAQTH